MRKTQPWFVYIVQCANGHYYAGVTNDLARRIRLHNQGKASKYTASRRPVELLWSQKMKSNSDAQVCEHKIKQWSRAKKEKLVQGLIYT